MWAGCHTGQCGRESEGSRERPFYDGDDTTGRATRTRYTGRATRTTWKRKREKEREGERRRGRAELITRRTHGSSREFGEDAHNATGGQQGSAGVGSTRKAREQRACGHSTGAQPSPPVRRGMAWQTGGGRNPGGRTGAARTASRQAIVATTFGMALTGAHGRSQALMGAHGAPARTRSWNRLGTPDDRLRLEAKTPAQPPASALSTHHWCR